MFYNNLNKYKHFYNIINEYRDSTASKMNVEILAAS